MQFIIVRKYAIELMRDYLFYNFEKNCLVILKNRQLSLVLLLTKTPLYMPKFKQNEITCVIPVGGDFKGSKPLAALLAFVFIKKTQASLVKSKNGITCVIPEGGLQRGKTSRCARYFFR